MIFYDSNKSEKDSNITSKHDTINSDDEKNYYTTILHFENSIDKKSDDHNMTENSDEDLTILHLNEDEELGKMRNWNYLDFLSSVALNQL